MTEIRKRPTLRKKILFIVLDDVVVDFSEEINKRVRNWVCLNESEKEDVLKKIIQKEPHFYRNLLLVDSAKECIHNLSNYYDIFFISSPYFDIPTFYTDSRILVEKHFGEDFRKKIIISFRKDLHIGHYLIDSNLNNGSEKFISELLLFGGDKFKSWTNIENYLIENYEVFWPETFQPKFRTK